MDDEQFNKVLARNVHLTGRQIAILAEIADEAVLGSDIAEVVKYLLTRALDDLRRKGRLGGSNVRTK